MDARENRLVTQSNTVINTVDVYKSFGDVIAVDGVSLAVQSNEFLALLGASGCGKTTLLRLLAGLERADRGSITIAGTDMTATPAYLRPVNLMFQSYALFPHMTVADNVAFGLKQDGLKGAELTARVHEALELVEMAGLAARQPHHLSGGQMQRVALARCIAKRPKVLLLDEPMAALDRALRERTRLELRNLRQRLGIAFVVVTHDQEDAMTMADRVAVMDQGKILQIASPRELYNSPTSRKVASFFGESNIWDGCVAPDGRTVDCAALGQTLKVHGVLPAAGTFVALSVRPERIALGAAHSENFLITATVEDVVYLGTVSTYLVRTQHGALIRITCQNGAHTPVTPSTKVTISWDASAVVVLRT